MKFWALVLIDFIDFVFKREKTGDKLIFLLFLLKLCCLKVTLIHDINHMLVNKSFKISKEFKDCQFIFVKVLIYEVSLLFMIFVINGDELI